MTDNIVLLGVLFLGIFVGFLLGLSLQLPKGPSVKLATAVIGAALGAAPVAFMEGLTYQKWMYPIGLVVGLLWVRAVSARVTISSRPAQSQRMVWYVAWLDLLIIVGVTSATVLSAAFVRTGPPPDLVQKARAGVGLCPFGGAEILNPRNVNVSGSVNIETVVRSATVCSIRDVKFRYDCDWPAEGPSWRLIGSGTAGSHVIEKDVPYSRLWNTTQLIDGRGVRVPRGASCQLEAVVEYENGRTVPNYSSFKYLPTE